MADIAAPAPVPIGLGSTLIWTNPANSGRNALVRVSFPNIDGSADVVLTTCAYRHAASAITAQLLPSLYTIRKGDGVEVEKVFAPGDSISASASATGDIVATVDVFWEPAP